MSNFAAVPQLVETVPYRVGPRKGSRWQGSSASGDMLVEVAAVNGFAKEYREQHKGKWMEVDRLGGVEIKVFLGSARRAVARLFKEVVLFQVRQQVKKQRAKRRAVINAGLVQKAEARRHGR